MAGEEGLKDTAAKVSWLAGVVLALMGQLRGAISADLVLLAAAGLLALVAVVQLELRQCLPAVGRLTHTGRMWQLQTLDMLQNVLAHWQVRLTVALAQMCLDAAGRHAVHMRHAYQHSQLVLQL